MRWNRHTLIAALAILGIGLHLVLRFGAGATPVTAGLPLYAVLLAGGFPLVVDLAVKAGRREFGSDPLAGMQLAASLERYSKHPLALPVVEAARAEGLPLLDAADVSEPPGQGLAGMATGVHVQIGGRRLAVTGSAPPPPAPGLECVIAIDGRYAATYRFRDVARADSRPFIDHLRPRHRFDRILLVSGDREQEVRYLAERVGITEVHAGQSPEQKVAITRAETARAPTLFIGDGVNDAPALVAATVGIAFGNQAEITAEAAGAVVMDTSLKRVDELLHIGRRMRRIALQSAVGGMALSVVGMGFAFFGYLRR